MYTHVGVPWCLNYSKNNSIPLLASVYTCTYVHVYLYMYMYILHVPPDTVMHVCVCVHVCIYMYIHEAYDS